MQSAAPVVLPAQAKIEALESIRGMAALLIAIFHIPRWNPALDITLIRNGHLMVDLFFVLSGFVICKAYSGRIQSPQDLARFQVLRFGRLYPVHLIFLCFFLLVEVAKYVAQEQFGVSSPNSQPFRESGGLAFVQQLFLVQAIGPTGNTFSFNGPAWSISVEFYTYLIFAMAVLLFGRIKPYVFATISLGSLLVLLTGRGAGFDALLSCTSGFFMGALVALATQKWKSSLPGIASLIVFAGLVAYLSIVEGDRSPHAILFVTAALIFTLVAAETGPLQRMLELRPLIWLGKISYSVYMSHAAVIWVANQLVRSLLGRPEVDVAGRMTPSLSALEALLAYALVIGAVLILSTAVFTFVEQPFREASRRFASRRWPVEPTA